MLKEQEPWIKDYGKRSAFFPKRMDYNNFLLRRQAQNPNEAPVATLKYPQNSSLLSLLSKKEHGGDLRKLLEKRGTLKGSFLPRPFSSVFNGSKQTMARARTQKALKIMLTTAIRISPMAA